MSDFLREDYTIDTPENVTFGYEVAGIGSRFIGTLIDSILIGMALLLLNVLLVVLLAVIGDLMKLDSSSLFDSGVSWVGGLIIALYTLLNFGVFWGYYMLFELLWNGQTPGKRWARIRVVRVDGNPAGVIEIVVRNLVRIVDFLPSGYGIGLVTMFFNRQARRLGDFAAGTLVVKERRDIKLENLQPARQTPAPAPVAPDAGRIDSLLVLYPQLRRLTEADYDLIQETLGRASRQQVDQALLLRLAETIATKVGAARPRQNEARKLLEDVVYLYLATTSAVK
ncbi:MAG: RDD family protein [Chloroflexi bacterium]|nr:RDD family protein [Chloroflexota bacterium]